MATISSLPRVTSITDQTLFMVTENGVTKVVTWAFIKAYSIGFSGSLGITGYGGSRGSLGFVGSQGTGYVGSQGPQGPAGGFTGSAGLGFVGSKGPGYTGSKGDKGDPNGYSGSQGTPGTPGYSGSRGVQGYIGSQSTAPGYTGSSGAFSAIGYVGSPGAPGSPGGFVGSQGLKGDPGGYTGSRGSGYTGSAIIGYVGSPGTLRGYTGSGGGGGGVGLTSRQVLSGTATSLANGATATFTINGHKTYALLKIQTSAAAWVRIYSSSAAQTSDASRTSFTDPVPGSGVIAEVITTGATNQIITPAAIGFNDDATITGNIYVRVTNQSGATASVAVTLTVLQLEA
jgi:hypothetical protein